MTPPLLCLQFQFLLQPEREWQNNLRLEYQRITKQATGSYKVKLTKSSYSNAGMRYHKHHYFIKA